MENTDTLQGSNPNVLKRLPRSQKKRLKREKKRLARRLKRPEVKKRRKSIMRSERENLLSSLSPDERELYITNLRRTNYEKAVELNNFLEKSYKEGLPICIDCSFGEDMNSKEIRSLAKQISLCYNLIKKYKIPIRLTLTSFSQSSSIYEDCQLFGFNNWKVHVHDCGFWELFDKDKIIVLSPDATECLEELSNDKVYVIGGLVDTNVKKNKLLNKAISHNISAKCLPIKKYVPNCKKTVLNVSTVFEILCLRLSSFSWEESLTKCLPSRSL
ncbi:tRNA (Guanine-1)-methyltransferase family protein [Theileria parva strain Muguga]|uniref:tRNA (Guanine-1)-methyltransferase family protein n=1 Tax=Theileria parva strain Muguga TaxID=333668 RepID=UPI001C61EB31|nr:tRNA (Guanine-1)-methyltransferase family protein [Theileria parva strain Muguga]EAN31885.2 tRNA (Guanine-1)-methyltransferase family protein [Theileria parva strain Muguga]